MNDIYRALNREPPLHDEQTGVYLVLLMELSAMSSLEYLNNLTQMYVLLGKQYQEMI